MKCQCEECPNQYCGVELNDSIIEKGGRICLACAMGKHRQRGN